MDKKIFNEKKVLEDYLSIEEVQRLDELVVLIDASTDKNQLLKYEIETLKILKNGYLRALKNLRNEKK